MTKLERAQAGLDRAVEHVVDAQNKLTQGIYGASAIALVLGKATGEIIKAKEALVVRHKSVYKKVDKRQRPRNPRA
jgi:hypothetical protein